MCRRTICHTTYRKLRKQNCNICHKVKSEELHHIIPVKNGGSNNKKNLLPICKQCHKDIHTKEVNK